MPSSMPTLDDQFPTLRGDEGPKEMFAAIVNYLFVMKESLDYTLANLSSDNWNSAAWNEMTEGAKEPLIIMEKQLEYIAGIVSKVNNELLTQRITVGDLTEDMGKTKDRVTALEGRADTVESDIDYLLEQAETRGGLLEELAERLGKLESRITVDENGATTIGKENTPLNLVGEVSINGTPYEEEET